MKKMQRSLALLLCAAMLMSLLGCQTQPDTPETTETTQAPTETDPPVTEPEELTAYRDAIAAVDAASSLSMRISTSKTTTIANETYEISSRQILLCSGLGTDQVRYQSEEAVSYSNLASLTYDEVYTDGVLYLNVNDNTYFSGEYTAEEMTQWYLPAVLVNPDLYGDISIEGQVLTFTQPTAPEEWAIPEEAEFIQASGTVTLSASGELQKSSYSITYTYGSADISLKVEAYVNLEALTIDAPADTDRYTPLQCLEAVYVTTNAVGAIAQAKTYYTFSLESLYCQAAGVLRNISSSTNSYNKDEFLLKYEKSAYVRDYSAYQIYEYDLEESYIDGVYSYAEDGGDPVTVSNVTAELVQSLYSADLTSEVVNYKYWQDAVGTDLGSLYLIELTLTDDFGLDMEDSICSDLWDDPDFLDDLSDSYENVELTAYIGIDKFSGIITAAGYYYEGLHTVNGREYVLTYQIDRSVQAPALGAYKEITGEMAPETEPENKATPLFYHVTGADGQEMWLFGTIHVGDNRTGYLPQEIYDALLSSDALAIECDTATFEEQSEEDEELQDAVSDAYYYSDGTTIQDHIDPEIYEAALKFMKATGSYNMNSEYLKPYLWYNLIDNFYLSQGQELTSDQGVEERLTKLAEENDIPLLEVESVIFQINMITSYSDELQELLLTEVMAYSGQSSWESTMELYELWCAGDEAALLERLADDEDMEFDPSELTEEELAEYEKYKDLIEEYNQAMSYDRNDGMLDVLIGYLESGDTVFVAVGLAHLLNNVNGLVEALRSAGYTVELVEYSK